MHDVDLWGSDLSGAHLTGTDLTNVDLRFADLRNADWEQIKSISMANIAGVKNAPKGFVEWALKNGAVQNNPGSN